MSNDYQEIWNKIKQFLQYDEAVDPMIFNNYVKNAYISDINNNHCLIIVDSIFAKEILNKNLKTKIEDILEKINHNKIEVNFIEPSDSKKEKQQKSKENKTDSTINNFFFENFIKGESNNEAYQAALAITIEPGKYWNPLFIYGNSGLGKTHLLHAIENEIIRKNKNKKKTIYLSSEEFGRIVPEILHQNSSNDIEKFKNSFNDYDVLLVDDIQFLANRSKTNEIFFHIFNNFVNKQKQIVITSDKSPDELYGFEERNISRFQSGLSVGIDSPDFETALTILKEKIKSLNYDPTIFTEETLHFIARNFNSDVRKLEGSLNRLIFYSILYLKPNQLMTIEDVMKAFKTNTNLSKEKLTAKKIKKIVAEYYNIPIKILNSSTRVKAITNARHIAMYLIKELLNESFVNIGNEFGGKDHTTVINAYNKIKKNIEQNYEFKKTIEGLRKECTKVTI
ncbi:chromosomal replication initiator protein DnaA [Spiroplasma platyhelix]|uniref:Chromosomal replication initiator protein DnaA n=1 Tax=Spiroplasma platyhelix PALS-1 TaxID=1276218 RepID=A0A846U523_9MOLU|nr:chromosomal replication initiator protein DnaA [Spiroplasma platyhelix]MBE4704184.1 Chromosomal replication initiator protein DnaA [Spiroplasma platyhelix PALS-1]NKE38557.1 chromosomal replication initiator protein DnaA [Spiroplasma platyhelix PALS-1]UJB28768.1 chromosomal replication initiation protein [Spiroplasma platyhelix PALS-1]